MERFVRAVKVGEGETSEVEHLFHCSCRKLNQTKTSECKMNHWNVRCNEMRHFKSNSFNRNGMGWFSILLSARWQARNWCFVFQSIMEGERTTAKLFGCTCVNSNFFACWIDRAVYAWRSNKLINICIGHSDSNEIHCCGVFGLVAVAFGLFPVKINMDACIHNIIKIPAWPEFIKSNSVINDSRKNTILFHETMHVIMKSTNYLCVDVAFRLATFRCTFIYILFVSGMYAIDKLYELPWYVFYLRNSA